MRLVLSVCVMLAFCAYAVAQDFKVTQVQGTAVVKSDQKAASPSTGTCANGTCSVASSSPSEGKRSKHSARGTCANGSCSKGRHGASSRRR